MSVIAQVDPLYLFVFFGLFTPGPNVILLTASGARYGFRRTVPHLMGVVIGVGITSGLTALGIGALLLKWPVLEWGLKLVSAAWMMWMAFGLWTSRPDGGGARDRPFTVIEAALFQWVNPKVWAVALAASSAYASDLPPQLEALRLASAFSGLNLFVCLFWSGMGALLAFLLTTPFAWKVFSRAMALALGMFSFLVLI
ncbi:Threonine/homoserine/homoserine lactone efflux protein [Shimia gijangensis]|uniref:Threonine/homoserine/homoserine lactone efflux protein n=1 Tax=Shimia gijangensis TaxID=1470563 RepID=A0A1M6MPR4_9RHOB|nr:Threonine/homoserine/homoserine lactone efflux protein [Shimia gijangensis]